jgi:hypothetical protein
MEPRALNGARWRGRFTADGTRKKTRGTDKGLSRSLMPNQGTSLNDSPFTVIAFERPTFQLRPRPVRAVVPAANGYAPAHALLIRHAGRNNFATLVINTNRLEHAVTI